MISTSDPDFSLNFSSGSVPQSELIMFSQHSTSELSGIYRVTPKEAALEISVYALPSDAFLKIHWLKIENELEYAKGCGCNTTKVTDVAKLLFDKVIGCPDLSITNCNDILYLNRPGYYRFELASTVVGVDPLSYLPETYIEAKAAHIPSFATPASIIGV